MKHLIKRLIKIVFIPFIFILLIFTAVLAYRIYEKNQMELSHEAVQTYLRDELIVYFDDNLEQSSKLIELINRRYVNDADKGALYERLAFIYQQNGDMIRYYDAIGKAIYYLDKGNNISPLVNIWGDLAYYYFSHGKADMAQDLLNSIYAETDIDAIDKVQTQSFIYRFQGILDINAENYDMAYEHLMKAREILDNDNSENARYKPSYYAYIDIALAEYYYCIKDYNKSYNILQEYKDSNLFYTEYYAEVTARDFIIPYYMTAIKVAARYKTDSAYIGEAMEKFSETCQKFDFLNYELELYTYMLKYCPSNLTEQNQKIEEEIRRCYVVICEELYTNQALMMDSQIDFALTHEANANIDKEQEKLRITQTIFSSGIVIFLILLVFNIYYQSGKDALTRVGNRHALNRKLLQYKNFSVSYSIIMMDIDNFKNVNDTYGHDKGDEVLARLGKILLNEREPGCYPFRFGGEEFIVFMLGANMEKVIDKAESIRKIMKIQRFEGIENPITISIGISMRENKRKDVIKCADENLYYSKKHGKNVVTYTEDGEPKLVENK